MKRFIPRTLFGRNFLLLVVLIVVTQIVAFLFFIYFVTLLRVERMADLTALQINLSQKTVADFSPSQREDYLKKVASFDGVSIVNMNQVPAGDQPSSALVRTFAEKLKARMDNPDSMIWHDAPRLLYIRIFPDAGSPYVVVSLMQIYAGPSDALIAALLITGLAAFFGAYLLQRRVNRPLEQLAASAHALGQGRAPAPLDTNAPSEINVVSVAINDMATNLAKLNEEKTMMLAGVSHDLRTPLSKMRLCIEMLGASADQALVSSLEKSAKQMEAIVDQFIDYARTGHEESPLPCDINLLVRETLAMFTGVDNEVHEGLAGNSARLDNVCVTLDVDQNTKLICNVRPLALGRAITNLINNAYYYARPHDGSVNQIHVTANMNRSTLVISVLDRGPGIAEAEVTRLTQAFTRRDLARSDPARSGLGLAIVDRVAKLHGGALKLAAREGGGLEASIIIPTGTESY
jgi:two-component system, OmpR family, osmolarity sensor histidine kinase EnvZ